MRRSDGAVAGRGGMMDLRALRGSMHRGWLAAAMVLILPVAEARVSTSVPVPEKRLPLPSVGYRVPSPKMMLTGAALMTLHYIDEDHLLLTHSARKLIPRMADESPDEDARLIRAAVIHLPEGNVEAETEWRTYDHGQYLWPLGNGRFLLRIKSKLYMFHPQMHGEHGGGKEFDRTLVYSTDRTMQGISLSPDGKLLTVQTSEAKHIGDDPEERVSHAVEIEFMRVEETRHEGEIQTVLEGRAKAKNTVDLAANARGMVGSEPDGKSQWGFDFRNFKNGSTDLAGMESSCKPQTSFVSESEFVAMGCRGGEGRNEIGGFNLAGEALWLTTTENPVWVAFSLAPKAGRFAYRNTWFTIPLSGGEGSSDPDTVRGQVVRVFRTHSGDEILRVFCSPAQRSGQNFALSPGGRKLAVVKDEAIEIYGLPPANADEKKALEKASQPEAQGELPAGSNSTRAK